MLLVVGMMSFTAAQAQNTYTIKATDTFGDGWNGGSLDVTVAGVTTSYTLATGGAGTIGQFMLIIGDSADIQFCGGAFPTEIGWSICDQDGLTITSGTGAGIAAGTCGPTNSLVAAVNCEFTLVKTDSFGDSWNGAMMDIVVNGATIATTTHLGGASSECAFAAPDGATVDFVWTNLGTFAGELGFEVIDGFENTIFSTGPGGQALGTAFSYAQNCPEPCGVICPTSGSGTWVEQYFLQAGECCVQATIPVEIVGDCEIITGVEDGLNEDILCTLEAGPSAANDQCAMLQDFDAATGTLTLIAPDDANFGGSGGPGPDNVACNFFGQIFQVNFPADGQICFDWEVTTEDTSFGGVGDVFGYSIGTDWTTTVASSANLVNNTVPISSTIGSGNTCVSGVAGEPLAVIVYDEFFAAFSFGPDGFLTAEVSNFQFATTAILPAGPVNFQTELCIGEDQIVEIAYDLADGTTISCEVEIDVFAFSGDISTALACNDDINVSVDENCNITIGADMFLEGGPYSCFDDYIVRIRPFGGAAYLEIDPVTGDTDANGATLPIPVGQHIYEVIDPITGNTCWGYFTVEDKFPPTLTCECPVGGNTDASLINGEIEIGDDLTGDWDVVNTCPSTQPVKNATTAIAGLTSYDVYAFTFDCDDEDYTIEITSSWGDSQAYLYNQPYNPADNCEGLVTFDGDGGVGFDSNVCVNSTATDPAGTVFYLYVSTWTPAQSGTYTVEIQGASKACGATLIEGITAPECSFLCYDETNWEVIDQLPGVTVTDNCGAGDLVSNDVWVDGDECGERILFRNWLLTDPSTGETTTCTQEFVFEKISVDDLTLPPATVVLDCGGDSSPEAIAADLGIEIAYPHFFVGDKDFDDDGNFIGFVQRAVAVNNNVCNLWASFVDVDITDCPGCPGNKKVIRSWSILDWCDGTTTPFTQIIKASDSEAPFVSAPDITVSVNIWGCTGEFYLPCPEHLGDDCYGDNLNYEVVGPAGVTIVQVPNTLCSTGYQYIASGAPKTMFDAPHTFTYVATDCCGNVGQSDIAVTVLDNTPPVAIAKEFIVISLTSTPGSQDGAAKMYPQSVDAGSHNGDCGDVALEIRRADGAPQCGNNGALQNDGSFYNNNVTFNNDVAPLVPSDAAHADDNRDDTDGGAFVKFCCEDLTDIDANGNAYGSVEVLMRVFDDGNMTGVFGDFVDLNGDGDRQDLGELDNYSDTWAIVRVEDKLAPQISCPADITLKCDQDYTDTTITGMASGSATCSGIGVTFTDDTNISTCGAGIVVRTWCIEGTSNCCTQRITVDYFSTWNPCDRDAGIQWPDDYTGEDDLSDLSFFTEYCGLTSSFGARVQDALECEDEETGIPEWTDSSCDLIGYSLDSDTFYFESNACFKVLNNWSVINWCIYNPNDADFNTIPNQGLDEDNDGTPNLFDADDNGNGIDDSYYFEPVTLGPDFRFYFDNEGGLYWVNYILGSSGRIYSIDVWDLVLVDGDNGYFGVFDPEAEDDGVADGIYEHTQVIKLIDVEPPVVTADENCYPVEDGCQTIPPVEAMACDTFSNCASEWIKWQAEVDINGDWVVDYVYSSFIADIPANRPFYVEPTQSCETVSLQLPAPIEGSKLRHRVLWRATDGCGNVTSYTSYFTVEDKKAPTPYCINLSTALMENGNVELWACDFDAGAFDNCTPTDWLRFTFNGPEDGFFTPEETPMYDESMNCQGKVFDCGHFEIAQANGGLLPVRIYVWDECGNVDFCMVNLRLVDNTPACVNTGASRMISGEVYTEEGEMLEDAMVASNEMTGSSSNQDMTNVDGVYSMLAATDKDHQLSAEKNDDYLNGVTTLDILLIQKHILDIQTLDSPYKLIAADASNDQKISGVDLIQIRKLILGITEEFPANDSWRFVDANETLNATSPWPFKETIDVMNLTTDMMEEDFIGVKIGDVNGSVDTHLFAGGNDIIEARSANDLTLNAVATNVGTTEVTVDITSTNFNEVSGMQFTMEVADLELTNVQAGALDVTAENFAVVNGKVTSSWNSRVAVSTDDVLFTLTFTGTNADALAINSSITKAEAYVGSDLDVVGIQLGTGVSDSEFALMQNEPNPFNNVTIVGFTLPAESTATLTVYDVTGKVITTVDGTYSQGYNEIELSKKDMSTSGVLYYQLDSGDFTATKKMIILD